MPLHIPTDIAGFIEYLPLVAAWFIWLVIE
jgi:hypothetical protein